MEILIQITAPSYGKRGEYDRRGAQFEANELENLVKLLGVRLGLGVPSGEITSGDGKATLRWKTKTAPIDMPADSEEAA